MLELIKRCPQYVFTFGLHIAKKHNMCKVLLNINDENLVSAHICEKPGGELMDKIQLYNDAKGHHVMRRYWIYL